ncbi:TonB-dependent receptor plug domain-containing protein [Candidatus Methylobacter oryzae]|nr:TonB-dependent receptor [Candidatus Methylobacter oryzae]
MQSHLPAAHAEESLSLSSLKEMSLEDVLQVEIVSKKAENKNSAAGIVSVVTHDDIKRYGANTLADVLNRVTSIYMLSTYIWSDSTAAMRGDALTHVNNHTLVLINGRPFRDSAYGGLNETMFRDFPIHHIEQIEVIRGSGSVLYGSNAFTGVINVVTKKHQDNALTLRGRYGSFNTGQVESEFAWKNDEAAITGAVRHRASDGWLFSAIDERKQPANFRNNDDDTSASLWGEWKDFNFNLFVVNNQRNHWGSVPIGSGQPIENDRLFFDVGYKHQINQHWSSTWNITFNKFSQNYNLPVQGTLYLTDLYENNVLFEQTHFLNFFEDKLNFVAGGLVEWREGGVTQVSQPNTLNPYTSLKSSIYGEASYSLLDNLKVSVGGQWHRFDNLKAAPQGVIDNGEATEGLVGRTGLVYELTSSLGAKLLYNQAYRSPSAGELGANSSLVQGNRNIQPELIESSDAQIFYHAQDYQISLTAFRSRVSNLIVRVPVADTNPVRLQYSNAGNAEFEGLELESEAKLFEGLSWKGAYTFQTNRDEHNQNNKTQMPNHMAKIGLSYDATTDLQISAFDTYFSAAKIVPTSLEVNPAANSYHSLSVNTNYRLDNLLGFAHTKHITFSFYLDNLLDEKFYYPEFNRKIINTIPASPGRSLFGEIAIEF